MQKYLTYKRLFVLVLLCWLGIAVPSVSADSLRGQVVRVIDGDTVEVLDLSKTVHRIRLAGIDAPERGQPWGTKAKQGLAALVGRKTVEVVFEKRDRYDRIVGKVIVAGQDANLVLVRKGLAWWYRKYADEQSTVDCKLYGRAEREARTERLGLWADAKPVPPWEWRHPKNPDRKGKSSDCPCGSERICTGPRGGRYCIRDSGTKRYFPR